MAAVGDVFKALADPTRRAILDELQERGGQTLFELCVRLLSKHGLGSTRQAVSQHLDVLEAAGLVVSRREGRYKFHDLDTAPLRQINRPMANRRLKEDIMRIVVTSVLVDDQEKALRFYTDVLGFVKKADIPMGEARWLTVVSAKDPDGTELLLEPDAHPAAGPSRRPWSPTAFRTPRSASTMSTPSTAGSRVWVSGSRRSRSRWGPVTTAVFDDTCGNLIQIAQQA